MMLLLALITPVLIMVALALRGALRRARRARTLRFHHGDGFPHAL